MARLTANEDVYVGFAASIAAADLVPTAAEVSGATNLTGFIVSLDSSTRGNQVPTPSLDTNFETSISGTVSATFTAEFYRDDTADTAWTTLPRGTQGYFIVSRYGATGTDTGVNPNTPLPLAGDTVEVWPVEVLSRSATPLSSNDSQRFQIECSINEEPNENATVAA